MKNNCLYLTSPLPPSVNHYLSPRAVIRNGKPFAFMYEAVEAKNYKEAFGEIIRKEVEKQSWRPVDDKTHHYYCDCVFYFDRIDKDANNYFKLLCDAVTESGVVWPDDNVVCERVQGIYYDSRNPRINITIYPVDYVGIFPTEQAGIEFEEACKGCVRYKNNCSILKNAKEGRISENIDDLKCNKFKEEKEK